MPKIRNAIMATSSLGTLTLDLAVKLSEFSDGLTRAEREARDSTSNISDSVSDMRDSIADDMSKISGSFAGMAIGGAIVAAGALASMAVEAAKADVQMSIMAGTANTSLKNFQVLTHAAQGLGVEQDALASILADVQEKLGEFSATGGGGAADFFEALQNNTKMTDEEITNLGKTLQGKDGVEAIQVVKDKMDELGATSQEQRFVFESLAGDLGNLMGLFSDGGQILDDYGVQLEDAGVIKSQDAIDQSRILAAETQAIQTKFEGLKTQLVTDMIPALGTLATHFSKGTEKGSDFREEVTDIGKAVNVTAAMIVGLAAGVGIFSSVMQQFSMQAGNLGQTVEDFYNADGFKAKGAALAAGATRQAAAGLAGYITITNQYREAVDTINTLMDGQKLRLSDLGQTHYTTNNFLQSYNEGLEVSTKQAEANAKAEEELAKAKDKTSKSISNQMMVYKAWRSAGLSDNQARIITAEVGRENDYQSKYLFGGHSDPKNKKYNLGMISWQKERGEALHKHLKDLGLIQNGQIVKTQEALNAQAMFALKEITTNPRFDRTKKEFLSNPDVDYDKGTEVLGNNYIAWRYKDPKYSNGHNRRDKHYNKLNSELGSDSTMKTLQAENKAIEDAQRAQLSIAAKWANEKEKIELDYQNNITEIKETYAEGSADYIKYMARVEERYIKDKNAGVLSLSEKYFSEEQRIHADHKKSMQVIEKTYIEDDSVRQYYVDAQKAAYAEDLENFRWAAGAKSRAQALAANNLSDVIDMSSGQAASAAEDLRAKQSMRPDLYQKWKLEKDYKTSQETVDQMYGSRKGEINALDLSTGDPVFDATQRNKLLQEAEQEHLNKMLLMEEEHSVKKKELDKQLGDARIAIQEMAFSSMTGAAAMFFGENSKMHKAAFAMEKAFAVQKALMNIEETYSNTFNAISAIPLIGPYIAMPMAIAASAMQVASAAGIQGMSAPSVSGIAHGGLDYVPKESTYLLDKGERVLSPNQNSDLTKFMNNGSAVQVNIINNSSSRVESSDGGRTITITDVRNEVKRGFAELNNPNSHSSKMVDRNVRGGRRR